MPTLPKAFEARIRSIHGQSGEEWLENLPALQSDLVQRWSLTDLQPVKGLSYNYLVFGTAADQTPVVLKIGIPNPELTTEILALREFDGKGAARLLDSDAKIGVLLLERILPGNDLRSAANDRAAARIAAGVMNNLWKPAAGMSHFPSAADWCQGFRRYQTGFPGGGPLPPDLVLLAASLAEELLDSSGPQLLLHGDLHQMNILEKDGGGWVAIDPKGVIGEAAFEVGALLLNPVPDLIHRPDLKDLQRQRLIILEEELKIDRERLAAWSFARSVLSAIWSLEEGGDWRYGIKVAETIKELI